MIQKTSMRHSDLTVHHVLYSQINYREPELHQTLATDLAGDDSLVTLPRKLSATEWRQV